jgi:hypothetical protein
MAVVILELAAAVHIYKILGSGILRHMLFDIVQSCYGGNTNNKDRMNIP